MTWKWKWRSRVGDIHYKLSTNYGLIHFMKCCMNFNPFLLFKCMTTNHKPQPSCGYFIRNFMDNEFNVLSLLWLLSTSMATLPAIRKILQSERYTETYSDALEFSSNTDIQYRSRRLCWTGTCFLRLYVIYVCVRRILISYIFSNGNLALTKWNRNGTRDISALL